MKPFNIYYKELLRESQVSTREEYDKFFDNYYKDKLTKAEVNKLKDMARQSEDYVGLTDFHVEKSDSGNLIVQWANKGDEIYIVGILSRSGHVRRDDLDDLRDWIYRLIQELFAGKTVISSPNEISLMLLDKVDKYVKGMGRETTREQIGPTFKFKPNDPLFHWRSYKIRLK